MARYIDADFLIEQLQPAKDAEWNKRNYSKSMSEMIEDFCTELRNTRTADVVEVVRCKNCIHFESITLDSGISVGLGNCKNKNGINLYPNETDFCSYGERSDT